MSEKLRTSSKDVKTMAVKIKRWRLVIKGRTVLMAHYLFTRHFRGPCAKVSDNHCHLRDETSSKKAWVFLQVLPRFQGLVLLFLRNRKLDNKFGNISADLSRLEIRDSDKANQVETAAHLFSFCGRNHSKSLQRQIHFNVKKHWGPTPTL